MAMVKNYIVNVVVDPLLTRVTLEVIIVKKVMCGVGGKEERKEHQTKPKDNSSHPKLPESTLEFSCF